MNWKETKDETRKRLMEDLKTSTAAYVDHAENEISKLQEAYLKCLSQRYSGPTEVSQRPQESQDVSNNAFDGMMSVRFPGQWEDLQEPESATPVQSQEGIPDITHEFRVSLLNQPIELVSDDDCRAAVAILNGIRLKRAEILEDGYDVGTSDILISIL